ncbi:NAD(P)H nitroreductase [Amylibacter kogurei]|uniref:NAD(P)H nitroreductase n=1 Tax=Paramylibacter kogurei TaxID=1889778 RepID=A0A2G5K6I7_9RHOB|nr:oxygen-insensitive NAD(P)H nitroreductase [Amylibacter kogurei]PIB25157.1 NAD(P)H nitroreductase [Amylibacter kogurei]
MPLDITSIAKSRHTAKAYDPDKKISDTDIEKVKELLRFSASSTNAQPWHFILASTAEGKDRIAKSSDGRFPFNSPSIRNASHVVVFASRTNVDEDYLLKILAQEESDGRFASDPETHKAQMHGGRSMFIDIFKNEKNNLQGWADNQTYLNVGQFLLGVAALGIDATPMEGIETDILDAEFGLTEKGYRSLVVVPIGYHKAPDDYNKALPKSRLPYSEILTEV